jgi:hypothetical protein
MGSLALTTFNISRSGFSSCFSEQRKKRSLQNVILAFPKFVQCNPPWESVYNHNTPQVQ